MKKTRLAVKDGELLESFSHLQIREIVTAKQIEETARFTWDYQQTHNRIQQLVKNGYVHLSKREFMYVSKLANRGLLLLYHLCAIAQLLGGEDSFVSFAGCPSLPWHV